MQDRHSGQRDTFNSNFSSLLKNLGQYGAIVDSLLTKLAKTLHPRFSSGIFRVLDLLQKYFTMSLCNVTNTSNLDTSKTIFDNLYEEYSLHGIFDDEITRFVRATANNDKNFDLLSW